MEILVLRTNGMNQCGKVKLFVMWSYLFLLRICAYIWGRRGLGERHIRKLPVLGIVYKAGLGLRGQVKVFCGVVCLVDI